MERCSCSFGAIRIGEVADQIAEALNNAYWAREGLEAFGREDLARRLDDVLAVLNELNEELTVKEWS